MDGEISTLQLSLSSPSHPDKTHGNGYHHRQQSETDTAEEKRRRGKSTRIEAELSV